MDLLAEAAADVGDDDPYVLQAKRFAYAVVDDFGNLSRDPNRQSFTGGIVRSDDNEGLKGSRAITVNLQVSLDNLIGGFKGTVNVAITEGSVPGQIATQFIEQGCGRWLDRFTYIDHWTERLVIHRD